MTYPNEWTTATSKVHIKYHEEHCASAWDPAQQAAGGAAEPLRRRLTGVGRARGRQTSSLCLSNKCKPPLCQAGKG